MDTSSVWSDLPANSRGIPLRANNSFWEYPHSAGPSDLKRCVYVIGPEGGPYKIGLSADPDRRAVNLSWSSRPLRVWQAIPVTDAFLVERRAHVALAAKRVKGEWFNCTLPEAVRAVRAAAASETENDF